MEEERTQLFELYDFFWLRHNVLLSSPFPAVSNPEPEVVSAPAAVAATEGNSTGATQVPPGLKPALRRTLADEVTLATSSDSALLARRPVKALLHTILSGKEASDEELEEHREAGGRARGCRVEKLEAKVDEIFDGRGHRERKRRHRERRHRESLDSRSKSLSELEFEELKGFMDLGFTFPDEADSDQRLLSIVPGLRRRASSSEEGAVAKENEEVEGVGGCPEESAIARPYLSEAWHMMADDDYDDEEGSGSSSAHDQLLRNWRVPATGEGIDMKDNLRSWAHTVASAVR